MPTGRCVNRRGQSDRGRDGVGMSCVLALQAGNALQRRVVRKGVRVRRNGGFVLADVFGISFAKLTEEDGFTDMIFVLRAPLVFHHLGRFALDDRQAHPKLDLANSK